MPGVANQIVETRSPGQRLLSLDALRGFDMFWIIGGEGIVHEAAKVTGWNWLQAPAEQLRHTNWDGFTLYDLIFPLFLFMAGVSMPFSFAKRRELGQTTSQLHRHVIVRGLVLVLLGMIYNGMLQFDWSSLRVCSVLGRIGLAYMLAAIIVLNTKVRGQVLWTIGVLAGYWAMLRFIPVPGYGAYDLAPAHTLTDYIDRMFMPGTLLHGDRDPEGLLSTIPSIGTALLGAITGEWLKSDRYSGYGKTLGMILAGCISLLVAWGWNFEFPINKNLWSSSFVLCCAGFSLLLMATFYLVVDVWQLRAWAFPFVVIGSNSILIYMASHFIDFGYTTHALFGGLLPKTGEYEKLLFISAALLVKWLFLYVLYKKRVFLRV
jgi:predicted acyltransferase